MFSILFSGFQEIVKFETQMFSTMQKLKKKLHRSVLNITKTVFKSTEYITSCFVSTVVLTNPLSSWVTSSVFEEVVLSTGDLGGFGGPWSAVFRSSENGGKESVGLLSDSVWFSFSLLLVKSSRAFLDDMVLDSGRSVADFILIPSVSSLICLVKKKVLGKCFPNIFF